MGNLATTTLLQWNSFGCNCYEQEKGTKKRKEIRGCGRKTRRLQRFNQKKSNGNVQKTGNKSKKRVTPKTNQLLSSSFEQ